MLCDAHTGEELPPSGLHQVSLLSAAELSSLLDGDHPPLVLEAVMGRCSAGCAFIPGAVLFSLDEIDVYDDDSTGAPLLTESNLNLRPPQQLRLAFERHGVHAERLCVVYTQCRRHTSMRSATTTGERGHHHRYKPCSSREGVADVIVASRLVWALAYAGVSRVALLDGGLSGWTGGPS